MSSKPKGVKPWRYGSVIATMDRARSHCIMCDAPGPSLMCETVHGVTVAFYHYCAAHWYEPSRAFGRSAAERTGTDVPIREWLELLEGERRAHAKTKLELAAACHELGHHVHCGPDCQGETTADYVRRTDLYVAKDSDQRAYEAREHMEECISKPGGRG